MSKPAIRAALQLRLHNWASTRTPPLPVAWENVKYTPTTGATYLRAFLLPAATDSIDLAGKHRAYTGVFQINIITEAGLGASPAEGIAEELSKVFYLRACVPATPRPVRIITPMNQGPGLPDGGTFTLPIWWEYRMDTPLR